MASAQKAPLTEDRRQALEGYIRELQDLYYPWYDRKQRSYKRQWQILQTLTVLSGFATSILAALLHDRSFSGPTWARALLVLLPLVGSLASTLLMQARLLELMALREKGRQTIQYLVSCSKNRYAALSDPEEITKYHQWLIEEIAKLAQEQATGFVALAPTRFDMNSRPPGKAGERPGS